MSTTSTTSTSTPSNPHSQGQTTTTTATTNNNKLQPVNYANVVAFVVNLVVTFGSSQFLPDNAELSAKYQTLVTPAGYAFAIWGIIFTAELVWTVVQALPSYRSDTLIIKGVGYNFVWACLAQAAWSILFGSEHITLSLVAMVLILIPLIMAVTQMERLSLLTTTAATTTTSTTTVKDYWLLKFPIQIHAAWIMAATLVNLNVVLVASNVSATGQATLAMLSLGIVLIVGLFYITKGLWVVPGVLAWAAFAIASELQQPRDSIVATFDEKTIEQTRVTAMVVASTVLALAIAKILYSRIIGDCNRTSSSVENETTTDYNPIS